MVKSDSSLQRTFLLLQSLKIIVHNVGWSGVKLAAIVYGDLKLHEVPDKQLLFR